MNSTNNVGELPQINELLFFKSICCFIVTIRAMPTAILATISALS